MQTPNKIVGIAKRLDHFSLTQALTKAKKKGLRLLTNREADALLQDEEAANAFAAYLPCLTATHVGFDGKTWRVTENGKTAKVTMPKSDGWYVADAEFGLPIGNKTTPDDSNARFLSRLEDRGGYAVRGWNHVDSEFIPFDDWRDVTLHDCDTHVGFLGTPAGTPRLAYGGSPKPAQSKTASPASASKD